MMSTQMIDMYEMLTLTQGQGRKVKNQGQICKFVKNNLFRLYITNQWLYILILFTDMIDNYRMMLTQVQGHKDKGQGQICNLVKKDILLYSMNK